jgi:endoglucanase
MVSPVDPKLLPPEAHVVGNRIQTIADAKPLWLQGLCVDSMEWSAGGEHILESIKIATEQWHANVIRLPMNEEFWFGRSQWQHDGGIGYRKLVDEAANAVAAHGGYLALDLHRFGAPMPQHVEFWTDAATRYKNNPAVIFELFNEPHSIPWKTWRDGGPLKDPADAHKDANAAENDQAEDAGVSVGMQALVDAIRTTGARNMIIAGGLDWGYDLSGITQGFALKDRDNADGIIYSSHIYPWKKGWQEKVLGAAEKYPIFVGEIGAPLERMPFIPPEQHESPYTWVPDALGLIQKYQLNWTAFSFHPTSAPTVISDWQYTPTPYWGAFVKDALAGKQFEMKKMR